MALPQASINISSNFHDSNDEFVETITLYIKKQSKGIYAKGIYEFEDLSVKFSYDSRTGEVTPIGAQEKHINVDYSPSLFPHIISHLKQALGCLAKSELLLKLFILEHLKDEHICGLIKKNHIDVGTNDFINYCQVDRTLLDIRRLASQPFHLGVFSTSRPITPVQKCVAEIITPTLIVNLISTKQVDEIVDLLTQTINASKMSPKR